MDRQQAFELINQNLTNKNLIKHCLAVEAVMKSLAEYFQEDQASWGLAGLLHDIDYEQTKDDPARHSLIGAEMLQKAGLDEEICQAVKTHNETHGLELASRMAKALFVTDPLTGLIVASTLVLPSKKIRDLTVENVMNRLKEKGFARGANREIIQRCTYLLDLSLEKFVNLSLQSMQRIDEDLGL